MFEINGQKEIVSALKNAKNRGVKINAVLDKSKSREIVQDEEFLKEEQEKLLKEIDLNEINTKTCN